MNTNTDNAQSQARAQYEGIVAMLAAVNCDYDRLGELTEEREALETDANDEHETPEEGEAAKLALIEWDAENSEELETLKGEAGDCEDEEAARERIQEDPLSVEVRSDWVTPGEEMTPGEFNILLCTGGPACRIRGELSEHGEPSRAWLEYQDWGTPWTQYFGAEQSVLIEYASHFYFQS